jgi:hypothetical protein
LVSDQWNIQKNVKDGLMVYGGIVLCQSFIDLFISAVGLDLVSVLYYILRLDLIQ